MATKIADTPILTGDGAKEFTKKVAKKRTIKVLDKPTTVPVEKIKEAVSTVCEDSKKGTLKKKDFTMLFRDHAINMTFPDLNFMYNGLSKKQQIFPPIDDTVEFLTSTSTTTTPLFRTFSIDELKERWEEQRVRDSKFPRNIYVYITRKYWWAYHKIKDFPREIKYFIQRGKRGYSDRDLWSYDHFLASIIGNGLKQLAETTHGWPDSKFETFEEWQAELTKIGDAFLDYIDESSDINFDNCKTSKDRKKVMAEYVKKCKDRKKILVKVIDHFECLWD